MSQPSPPQTLPARRFFARLVVIYILDWVVIFAAIIFAGSSTLWAYPSARPFDPEDHSISFPFQHDAKIPTTLLVAIAVVIPAVAILFFTLVLPSRSQSYISSFRTTEGWKRRFYCLNSAWLGLLLSISIAMLVTNGLKNLTGKPRPDMLDRCNVIEEAIEDNRIGPNELVTWEVCASKRLARGSTTALDESDLRDGFRSFPSGHASMSFAGLTYLAIFLAEFVFALPIAAVAPRPNTTLSSPVVCRSDGIAAPNQVTGEEKDDMSMLGSDRETPLPRFPIMAVILICGIPLLVAAYISTTRYSDYRHHPFDILFGATLGLFAGIGGWRWYGAWCCAGGDGRVYGVLGVAKGGQWKKAHRKRRPEFAKVDSSINV